MNKKEQIKRPEVKLCIKTYKIPITIEKGEVKETTLDLKEDMVILKKEITVDPNTENLSLKIPEYGKQVSKYNSNQKRITLELGRDHINKQILTKQ